MQSSVAAALVLFLCGIWLLGHPLSAVGQVAVLLGGMALTGIPHGAFDHLVARAVLAPRIGRGWWAVFLVAYLGLMGSVWLAWLLKPAAVLAAFLAMSILHFGLGDVEDGLAPARLPVTVSVLAYGAMPVLLPLALHAHEAAPVLAAMAGRTPAALADASHIVEWLLPAWCLAFGGVLLAAWCEHRPVAERVAMALGFAVLPPLLAFGLYFAFGHAVRHLLRLGAWRYPGRAGLALGWLAGTLLPTAALCGLGLAALTWSGQVEAPGTLAAIFRAVAALTLPHMLVTLWLEKLGSPGHLFPAATANSPAVPSA